MTVRLGILAQLEAAPGKSEELAGAPEIRTVDIIAVK